MVEETLEDLNDFLADLEAKGLLKGLNKDEKAVEEETTETDEEGVPDYLTAKEVDKLLEEINKTMGDLPPPPPKSPEELQRELDEEYKDVFLDENDPGTKIAYAMYGKKCVQKIAKRCNKLRAIIRTSKDPKIVEEAIGQLYGSYLR